MRSDRLRSRRWTAGCSAVCSLMLPAFPNTAPDTIRNDPGPTLKRPLRGCEEAPRYGFTDSTKRHWAALGQGVVAPGDVGADRRSREAHRRDAQSAAVGSTPREAVSLCSIAFDHGRVTFDVDAFATVRGS